MLKCVKYIEVRLPKEIEGIAICESSGLPFDVVDLSIIQKFPERFLWKNDPKAIEGVKSAKAGPFNFVVLFFEEIPQ